MAKAPNLKLSTQIELVELQSPTKDLSQLDGVIWLPHTGEVRADLEAWFNEVNFFGGVTKMDRPTFDQINAIDSDFGTLELAQAIVHKLGDTKVAIIRALIPRALCDVNRLNPNQIDPLLYNAYSEQLKRANSPVRHTFDIEEYPTIYNTILDFNQQTHDQLEQLLSQLPKGAFVIDLHSMMDRCTTEPHYLHPDRLQTYIEQALNPAHLKDCPREIDFITEKRGQTIIKGRLVDQLTAVFKKVGVKFEYNKPYFLTDYHLNVWLYSKFKDQLDYLLIDIPKRYLAKNPDQLDNLIADDQKIQLLAQNFAQAIL